MTALGHNQAPVEEIARDEIVSRLAQYMARVSTMLDAVDRAAAEGEISTDDFAGRVADLTKQVQSLEDAIDAVRSDVKSTYDRASAVVQAEAMRHLDKLRQARGRLQPMLDDYAERVKRAREAQKRREEEARRQRAVEEAKARAAADRMVAQDRAEAPAAKPSRQRWPQREPVQPIVRGDMGSVMTTRRQDHYRIVDVRKLPDQILNAPKVHEAIVSVIRTLDKSGVLTGDLSSIGVEKSSADKAQVR